MANVNQTFLAELEAEKEKVGEDCPHALKLLTEEIDRVQKGPVEKYKAVHHDRPIKITEKILIPVKEFPKFNFAGKLLGPKGSSLKKLQEDTGSKMSILGRGVMRDRNKEEELRKQGGKFSHLNEEQHILIEVFAHPGEAYQRLAAAVAELRRYLVPDYNDEIGMAQRQEMGMVGLGQNGASNVPPQRGRGRGGPAGRGAPGAMRGGRGGMNALPVRGGAAQRGAPRGRGGMGAPRAPAPVRHEQAATKYEQDYGSGNFGGQQGFDYQQASYQESGFEQSGGSSYDYQESGYQQDQGQNYDQGNFDMTSSDSQFFDYNTSSRDQGFGDQGYGESWQSQNTYGKAPSSGGRGRGDYRSHPYNAASSRGARF